MQEEQHCQEIRLFGSGMGSLLEAALGFLSQYQALTRSSESHPAAASAPLNQPGDGWLWGEPKHLRTGIFGSSFSVTQNQCKFQVNAGHLHKGPAWRDARNGGVTPQVNARPCMSRETSSVLSWKLRAVGQIPTKPLKFMSSIYMQKSQKIPAVTFLCLLWSDWVCIRDWKKVKNQRQLKNKVDGRLKHWHRWWSQTSAIYFPHTPFYTLSAYAGAPYYITVC